MTDTPRPPSNSDLQALFDGLNPIVALTCALVTENADLTDEGVQQVKAALEGVKATPTTFVEAIDALQESCSLWDTTPDALGNKYNAVARRIRDLLSEAAMAQFYKEHVTDESVEKRAKIGAKFAEFADKETAKAPKEGEAKPEGAVDLNALNFPKRL